MNPPSRTRLEIALQTLEEEGFVEFLKHRMKERLMEIDLVTTDPDQIAHEVKVAREQSQQLDKFIESMREYIHEA